MPMPNSFTTAGRYATWGVVRRSPNKLIAGFIVIGLLYEVLCLVTMTDGALRGTPPSATAVLKYLAGLGLTVVSLTLFMIVFRAGVDRRSELRSLARLGAPSWFRLFAPAFEIAIVASGASAIGAVIVAGVSWVSGHEASGLALACVVALVGNVLTASLATLLAIGKR
jgi:hypothetical protein